MSRRRHQYYTCPYCGAHLDAGERCDCTADMKMSPGAATPKGTHQNNHVFILTQKGRQVNHEDDRN